MRAGSKEDVLALAGAIKKSIKPGEYSEFDRLLDQHFSGQTRGGFTATQFPELRPKNVVTKAGALINECEKCGHTSFKTGWNRSFVDASRERGANRLQVDLRFAAAGYAVQKDWSRFVRRIK